MIYIDVRTREEYADNIFPQAINIPLDNIMNSVEEIKQFNEEVVIVCASGVRAGIAVDFLNSIGIPATNGGSVFDK